MLKGDKIETYWIKVEVRDSNGKRLLDENGNKVDDLLNKVEMLTSNMESTLKHLASSLKVFMPDRKISIEVYVYNEISATCMNMFSYYVNDNKFVQY